MKIAIVCPPSSPAFLPPVEAALHAAGHWTARFDDDVDSMAKAEQFGDVVWCEWARGNAVAMSRSGAKPLVVRCHRYEVWEPEFLAIDWSRVALLIMECPALLAEAIRRCPAVAAVRTAIIDNAIDVADYPFDPAPRQFCQYRIACVGPVIPRKNPWAWLQVLAAVQARIGCGSLHVAGSCPDDDLAMYMRHTTRDRHVSRNIETVGPLDAQAFRAWLGTMDFYLSASWSEGGPVAAIEAMALGVVPVIHDFPGAESRFPMRSLWRTVPDAAAMICVGSESAPRNTYRDLVESRYSLTVVGPRIVAAVEGVVS